LIGFWQSYKYFEDIADQIRYDFESKHFMNKINSDFLKSMESETTVSIHIRRGDYDDGYHGFCSLEYYQKAITYMQDKF